MAALDTPLLSGCHRVEVSGWDEDEMFFVEKSQLAGNDLTGRHVYVQFERRTEARRYTDNRYRHFVQEDRLADDMGVCPKHGLPIAVAQHGDGLSPRCVIRRLQCTSQRGSNAQRFKEISGDQFTVHDSTRRPKRKPCRRDSSSGSLRRSRYDLSFAPLRPVFSSAARRACSGDMPARRLSAVCISRCAASSSFSSRSSRSLRNKLRKR